VIVGSGIDVIEIARIARALGRGGGRFARRVYTEQEISACEGTAQRAVHFAVRFAAKEAAMKAVGTGWAQGVRWVDIETVARADRVSDLLGLELRGRVADHAARWGPVRLHLAVGRSRTHAMALVLLERIAS
jgi:holo-[acyl-carrier protein] synthase